MVAYLGPHFLHLVTADEGSVPRITQRVWTQRGVHLRDRRLHPLRLFRFLFLLTFLCAKVVTQETLIRTDHEERSQRENKWESLITFLLSASSQHHPLYVLGVPYAMSVSGIAEHMPSQIAEFTWPSLRREFLPRWAANPKCVPRSFALNFKSPER